MYCDSAVIRNNLCLLTCGRTFIWSKWSPNILPSSKGNGGGNRALKVNFVCLHGSINVTTHVLALERVHELEGILICPFWYGSSGHGYFALNLYLSSSHHLNQALKNRRVFSLMVLGDGVEQHSCARLHMMSCRWRYSTDDHPPGCVHNLKQLPSQSMTSQAAFLYKSTSHGYCFKTDFQESITSCLIILN